jgi:uncharacterized protein YdeI (YjbR/CyaY-like superfamily)
MKQPTRTLPVIAFASQQAFDHWLTTAGASSAGIWMKLAKKASGIASISQPEAVETALCHGWIDGQLDAFDDDHWLIRFTPRKAQSKWSQKNCSKIAELVAAGRMKPSGIAQVELAKRDGRWDAAYAGQGTAEIPDDLAAALAKNKKADAFFTTLGRSNRYAILYRLQDAKKSETRARRLADFIAMLERGETIHLMKPKPGKTAVPATKTAVMTKSVKKVTKKKG